MKKKGQRNSKTAEQPPPPATNRQHAEEVLATLLKISQAIATSANLQELLIYIHQQLGQIINADNFYVALYDEVNNVYSFPYWVDEVDTDEKIWVSQTLSTKTYTDYVRRTGKPTMADWESHERLVAEGELALSNTVAAQWLGVPLRTPNGIIGVVVVQSYHDPHLYSAQDLDLLTFTSDTIAIAIERKATEDKLIRYRDHLEELVALRTAELASANAYLKMEIIERSQFEATLKQSEDKFSKVFQTSVDGICIIRFDDGVFVDVNHAFCNITGYDRKTLIGNSIAALSIWYDVDDRKKIMAYIQENGKFEKVEFQFYRKNGDLFIGQLSGSVIEVQNETCVITAVRDITHQKQAETEREQLIQEIQRSNQALHDFASVASHDLKEPLRKIQTFSNRLETKYRHQLDERGQDYLARMQSAAARGLTLIDDLLAFSRLTTNVEPFTEVNLTAVVKSVLVDLENHIERTNATVEVMPLPRLQANKTQMRQLFQNLISNALKFHQPDVPPLVKIQWDNAEKEDASQAEISVTDNGIGFEETFSERIFAVFQRLHTRREFEGSGMGLAICKQIVDQHNGRIFAKSTPGKGSTFTIILPLSQPTT